jgi:hypothetical protein
MCRRSLVVGFLLLVPQVALTQAVRAQDLPERLLPGGSQIYFRWDGIDKHRVAFDKTATGQMLKQETGKFLTELWTYLNQLLDMGLEKADPKVAALIKEIPPILSTLHHNGFVLGIEARSLVPPEVDAVFVFPKAGGPKGSLVPLIEKLAKLGGADVKQTKVGARRISAIEAGPVNFGWWQEANSDVNVADVVLTLGTSTPADRAKAIESGKGSFAQSKTFAALKDFKEFPTWSQAYVDLGDILKKVADLNPAADQIIGDLGLKGLTGIAVHSGISGDSFRNVVDINMPGSRKGLLALINKKKISLANLPPLPSDITGFSVSNFNPNNLYEGALTLAQAVTNVFAPGTDPREIVRQVEGFVGVKFGEDLFGNFDDLFVTYSSPAEGPFGLGSVYLFKVKDEKKLRTTLDGLFKAIPGAIPFVPVEILYKKRDYRGGEIMELSIKSPQGQFSLANMTIHKGWFMMANYPQSLYGFILRTKGDLPTYKMDDKLTKALAALPKDYTALSVSDPRPGVTAFLSVFPPLMSFANSILPNVLPGAPSFDVSTIPHAQDAVRTLFPTISVTTDDGKKIRIDTKSALPL